LEILQMTHVRFGSILLKKSVVATHDIH